MIDDVDDSALFFTGFFRPIPSGPAAPASCFKQGRIGRYYTSHGPRPSKYIYLPPHTCIVMSQDANVLCAFVGTPGAFIIFRLAQASTAYTGFCVWRALQPYSQNKCAVHTTDSCFGALLALRTPTSLNSARARHARQIRTTRHERGCLARHTR